MMGKIKGAKLGSCIRIHAYSMYNFKKVNEVVIQQHTQRTKPHVFMYIAAEQNVSVPLS